MKSTVVLDEKGRRVREVWRRPRVGHGRPVQAMIHRGHPRPVGTGTGAGHPVLPDNLYVFIVLKRIARLKLNIARNPVLLTFLI